MLVQHGGRAHSEWFPSSRHHHTEMDKSKSFPLHPDDVWLVAYPKAGSTWTQWRTRRRQASAEWVYSVPWLEALSRMYPNVKVEELPSPHTFQGSSRVLLPSPQRFQVNQSRGNHLGEPFRKSLLQATSLQAILNSHAKLLEAISN